MLEFFDIIPWTTDSTSYPLVFLGGKHDQDINLCRKSLLPYILILIEMQNVSL